MNAESKIHLNAVINAQAINAEKSSGFINCRDIAELTVKLRTGTRVAFTAIHVEIDWYETDDSEGASPVAHTALGAKASQDGTNTNINLEPDKYTRTTSATITGECFTIPCKDSFCKIRVSSTAGDATDTVTVDVVLIRM